MSPLGLRRGVTKEMIAQRAVERQAAKADAERRELRGDILLALGVAAVIAGAVYGIVKLLT